MPLTPAPLSPAQPPIAPAAPAWPPVLRQDTRTRPSSEQALAQVTQEWGGDQDLWVFGYGSLIWRPEFESSEQHLCTVHGWHRALKMWSRVNRGTPEQPGLVLALLTGGSCKGMAFRIPKAQARDDLPRLWAREMPNQGVYDAKWLTCITANGPVKALAFTLSRESPNFTGELTPALYQQIFTQAKGRYGSTLDYARATHECLVAHGIHDRQLARLLAHAPTITREQ